MIKILIGLFLFLSFSFTACKVFQPEDLNHDPLPLVSPLIVDASSGDEVQTFQLCCCTNPEDLCLYDEDGDRVSVVLDEKTPLPAVIVLDETTGILTVTRSAPFTGTAKFWTVDGKGGSTELDALIVSFTVTVVP